MNASIYVSAKPDTLSTKPTDPGLLATNSQKAKYKKDLLEWEKEQKLYKKWNGKNLGEINSSISNNMTVARSYFNDYNLNENNYKFKIKLLNKGVLENKELLLCSRKVTSEYWPYKESYVMKSVNYSKVSITSQFIEEGLVGPARPYVNSLPTYVNQKTNKAPDSTRTNQLLATYNWRVGATNKEIIVPSISQNAEIGSVLTK